MSFLHAASGIYIKNVIRQASFLIYTKKNTQLNINSTARAAARRPVCVCVFVGFRTADSYNTGCSTVECKGLVPRVGSDFREPRAAFPSIFLFRIRSTSLFKVFGGLASTSECPVALEDSSNQWLVLESI